jgi:ABC-type multidrug transport system fused ATPase/permease subunit
MLSSCAQDAKNSADNTEPRIGEWIEAIASSLGMEAEPTSIRYPDVEQFIRCCGPAVLTIASDVAPRFIVAVGQCGRNWIRIIGPDLREHRLPQRRVRDALCARIESSLQDEVNELLTNIGVSQRRQARVRRAVLRQRLRAIQLGGCWMLRLPLNAPFSLHARRSGMLRRFAALLVACSSFTILRLVSWWMIGRGVLNGQLDKGWLIAWTLLLFTLIPARQWMIWLQGRLAITAGELLKQRLLYGAMRLEPEEVRHQGVGQLLGRVIESEAVESLALSGGSLALLAAVEILCSMLVLAFGAGGTTHSFLFLAWVALSIAIGWNYIRKSRDWSDARLNLTHDLVERMAGYRTRLAQSDSVQWHDQEDAALDRYLDLSKKMDRTTSWVTVVIPRGWMILGLLGLAPALLAHDTAATELAISLGGILFAFRALEALGAGLIELAGAAIAWERVQGFFQAATRPLAAGRSDPHLDFVKSPADNGTLLEARDVCFRYGSRAEAVLRTINIRINKGDRVLLEGPSGSGKSTLVSLLAGLRTPESGSILLDGLDRPTLGSERWRQRVVVAPQFHENHVFTETMAFNLLMGRGWPPTQKDLEEAEAICRELGLGDLLDRMPARMLQMVGDSGWQLSPGEKSRLYVARALLQRAQLVILDESFAALDPDNLSRAFLCALQRSSTIIVIAHL